jgi:hypothetical protein
MASVRILASPRTWKRRSPSFSFSQALTSSARIVKKLERAEDKEPMMVRFDEEEASGVPVSVRDRDAEAAASAAE